MSVFIHFISQNTSYTKTNMKKRIKCVPLDRKASGTNNRCTLHTHKYKTQSKKKHKANNELIV